MPTFVKEELLESLILNPGDSTPTITRRWSDAFNVQKVTKSFYLEFRALRDRLVEMLHAENPKNPLLAEGDDESTQSDIHRYVTRNLTSELVQLEKISVCRLPENSFW